MTPDRKAELQRLCSEATPGPWEWNDSDQLYGPDEIRIVETDNGVYPPIGSDRAFIASSRTAVPELLAEIERLEEKAERDHLAEVEDFEVLRATSMERISQLEFDLAEATVTLGTAQERMRALGSGLREALAYWRYPPLTAAEKARKDEIWSLVNGYVAEGKPSRETKQAVMEYRPGPHPDDCVCGGDGWLWGYELTPPEECPTDTRYPCHRQPGASDS